MNLKLFLRKFLKLNFNKAVKFKNLFLPDNRSNENLNDNSLYLVSSVQQVNHLIDYCKLNHKTRLLDFGCGQGRLFNGITYLDIKYKKYVGIDTNLISIKWCKKWLSRYSNVGFFIHLPAYNARYNKTAGEKSSIPFPKKSFDLIFLNSVFSHMLTNDIIFYLNDFNRILSKSGIVYLTAFIEKNVPNVEENPENYIGNSSGRLHRVRYEKNFFCSLVKDAGFSIKYFLHQEIERTKQSVLIIEKI